MARIPSKPTPLATSVARASRNNHTHQQQVGHPALTLVFICFYFLTALAFVCEQFFGVIYPTTQRFCSDSNESMGMVDGVRSTWSHSIVSDECSAAGQHPTSPVHISGGFMETPLLCRLLDSPSTSQTIDALTAALISPQPLAESVPSISSTISGSHHGNAMELRNSIWRDATHREREPSSQTAVSSHRMAPSAVWDSFGYSELVSSERLQLPASFDALRLTESCVASSSASTSYVVRFYLIQYICSVKSL